MGGALANRKPPSTDLISSPLNSTNVIPPFLLFPPIRNTALALASWRSPDQEKNLQLFYQTTSGSLRGRAWTSSSGWVNDSFPIPDAIAKNNTPIAQTSWPGSNGDREIQLFYLKPGNVLCNAVYSSGTWSKGDLEAENIVVAEDGKMAAITWNSNTQVRVYYQNMNNTVQEIVWGKGTLGRNIWVMSNPRVAKMIPGAGIGALSFVEGGYEQIRIYTQDATGAIVSEDYREDGWHEPYQMYSSSSIPLGTSIATSIVNTSGERWGLAAATVYFVGEAGMVKELTWKPDAGTWALTLAPANLAEGNIDGSIVAVDWGSSDVRLVYEKSDGGLGETALMDDTLWKAADFGN